MKNLFSLIACLLLTSQFSHSQFSFIDSSINFFAFHSEFGYQFPGGDLKKRYGANYMIGGGSIYKFKNNWLIGGEINYLFGPNLRETGILDSLKTSKGYLIDGNGGQAEIYVSERGFNFFGKLGKTFPCFGSNKNSGIIVSLGAGFLQHNIRLDSPQNITPQISEEYEKGYDRLTNGFSIQEFIGFQYFGKYRLISFNIGIEFIQAWTQSRRSFDYDLRRRDTQKRFDTLTGVRFTWLIPLYRRKADMFYYY